MSATFGTIKLDVFRQLKETKGTDLFWTEEEVENALNDTYYEIANKLMCFLANDIIQVIAATRTYNMPSDYILGSIKRVEFNERIIWPKTPFELDIVNKAWRSVTATIITNYFFDPYVLDDISVYPLPTVSGASGVAVYGKSVFTTSTTLDDPTNNLRVFYAKYPTKLVNDTDTFLYPFADNPTKILTKGAMAILLMKEGEGKDIEKAKIWHELFQGTIETSRRE